MKDAGFSTQLARCSQIAIKLNILRNDNKFLSYPKQLASTARNLDILKQWKLFVSQRYYNLQLNDLSLLQIQRFNTDDGYELHYTYLQCPLKVISYPEFVEEFYMQRVSNSNSLYEHEYQEYVDTCETREHVLLVRYDYQPRLYAEGRHPASHMHIGIDNEIRISTEKILKPISFLYFVLRQVYPLIWEQFLNKNQKEKCKEVREDLEQIPPEYIKGRDYFEMRLL